MKTQKDSGDKEKIMRNPQKDFIIRESFWIDYVIRTGQFHKGRVIKYKIPQNSDAKYPFGGDVLDVDDKTVQKWLQSYYMKYPDGGFVHMSLYFFIQEPLMVLQKFIFSPIFYFSMSARPVESYVKLIINIFSIILTIIGLSSILKKSENKKEIIIILAIIFGFSSLYFVSHCINRYSYPIIPFLYIWSGVALLKIKRLDEYLKKKSF